MGTRRKVGQALKMVDPSFITAGAANITKDQIEKVYDRSKSIEELFRKDGPLKSLLSKAEVMIDVVKCYWKGEYREIPWLSLSAIVFSLLYVFNPFDLLPDAIPGFGQVDDAAVVALCLKMVGHDLNNFKKWRRKNCKALAA